MLTLLLLAVAAPPTHVVELNGHRFTLPVGFTVELAADPALVKFPVAAAFDPAGNLFVTEASGTNDPPAKQNRDLPHRLLRLPATTGRFDRAEVFADKLMLPQGVMWQDGAVFVGAPPTITRFPVGPDGKAAGREVWHDGQSLTGCANDLHGPYPGPDGWIYWTKGAFAEQTFTLPTGKPFRTKAAHIYRARPDGTGREPVFTAGMDNPVDVVFTPGGERFVAGTFLQHPADGKRDGLIHAVYGGVWGKDHGPVTGHPWTAPTLMPPMTHLGPAAPSGLHRYASDTFGPEFRDNLFCTQFNLRKVSRHVLVPDGATFRTADSDFLVSDNLDFHPTDVTEAPDGSLVVIDTGGWYKLCCPTSQLVKPDVRGAIYRVRKVGAKPTPRPANPRLDAVWAASRSELKSPGSGVPVARAALTDADETVRQAAVHVVGLYRDKAAVPALLKLLESGTPYNQRAAAESLGRIGDSTAVMPLLLAHRDVTDRVLQHSLTYALIEIADPTATAAGLRSLASDMARATLVALDQMPGGTLKAADIIQRLGAGDAELRAAAWWVAGRHPEWGEQLAPAFRTALAEKPTDELADRLARFAGVPAVQAVLADALTGPGRRVALTAMAKSDLKAWPAAWWAAVEKQPLDADLIAAVKAISPTPEQFAALVARVSADNRLSLLAARPRTVGLSPADFDTVLGTWAVDTLGRGGLTADQLAAVADALPRAAVTDLPRLFDLFANAPEPAVLKLLAVVAADAGLRATVRPERVRQLTEKASPAVRTAATPVLAMLEAGLADQRQKLETLLAELPAGDGRRGQQVFNGPKAVCITCHQMGYVGGKVGPEITGANRSDLGYLLENVFDPSAVIPKEYAATRLALADGRVVTGIVKEENAATLTVATANETLTLPAKDVDGRTPSELSMMPDDLLNALSADQVRDLFAYLKHPQQVPQLATPETAKDLFNGTDLTGWVGDPKLWSVENGEIVGRTTTGLKSNAFLVSSLDVTDFRLTLSVKLVPDAANSGVQFRSRPIDGGEMKGPQADIGKGWWGKLYEENGRGLLEKDGGEQWVKPGEWNEYVVEAVGGDVKLTLNGHVVADRKGDALLSRRGQFGLQVHSGGPTEVRFKGLKLELPGK